MKDPAEIRPPGSNRFLVILRVEKPRDCIAFTLLDLHLDFRQRATIESIVSVLK